MATKTRKETVWPPKREQSKFTRLALNPVDFEGLRHIGIANGLRDVSQAVRLVIRRQAARDCLYGGLEGRKPKMRDDPEWRAYVRGQAVEDVAQYRQILKDRMEYERPEEEQLRQWGCRLYNSDLDNLEAVASAWGIGSRTKAVRFAVRVQATLDGFSPKGGW